MEMENRTNVKSKLINIFLRQMPRNIIDISYDYEFGRLNLQVVLLKGSLMSNHYEDNLKEIFEDCIININIIYITKEDFNQNIGNWLPTKYNWLNNVLYSKAEIL